MLEFKYKAVNDAGEEILGSLQAENKNKALNRLNEKGFYIYQLEEAPRSRGSEKSEKQARLKNSNKAKTLIMFTRQLANLLKAGVPLGDALNIISRIFNKNEFQEIVNGLYNSLKEGKSFSRSLSQYPEHFNSSYISMIEAGENSGFLDLTCRRIAANLEDNYKLRSFIISSLIYPLVIVVVAVIAVIVMLVFVLPQFVSIYQTYGQSLPWITSMMLDISNFISSYWIYLLLTVLTFVTSIWFYLQTPTGKRQKEKVILKTPVVGKLMTDLIINRLTRSIGTMLQNGVTLLRAVGLSADIIDNSLYREAVNKIKVKIKRGGNFSEAMSKSNLFPELAVYMIGVGEQTGNLDEMMLQVAEHFEEEYKTGLKNIMRLFEPLLILAVGLIIGFIIIAMILPILGINSISL